VYVSVATNVYFTLVAQFSFIVMCAMILVWRYIYTTIATVGNTNRWIKRMSFIYIV